MTRVNLVLSFIKKYIIKLILQTIINPFKIDRNKNVAYK